jgi:hypothetical protein
LVNDYGAAIYGILLGGISHHQREKQHRKTKEQFFHSVSLLRQHMSRRMQKSIFGYAKSYSRSHDAVIRVHDAAGNMIATHEHKGDFKEP